ncbi:hypothetical protein MTO96_009788 [Rhipicephalus appendiculatus]
MRSQLCGLHLPNPGRLGLGSRKGRDHEGPFFTESLLLPGCNNTGSQQHQAAIRRLCRLGGKHLSRCNARLLDLLRCMGDGCESRRGRMLAADPAGIGQGPLIGLRCRYRLHSRPNPGIDSGCC